MNGSTDTALMGLSVRSLHRKKLYPPIFFHLFPCTYKIISKTICAESKITCCHTGSFFHPNLSLCWSSKLQQNRTGSKRRGGKKTDHSNVRGLWTSQMHSERPLIKIISTGDGQRRGKKKTGASLADVKSHFCYLIYLRPKQEIHQSFC